jgi:signal transduction histidine kinase
MAGCWMSRGSTTFPGFGKVQNRMGRLINDLLNLSRITTLADFTLEPVNLSLLAERIAAERKAEVPQRQVDFQIEADLIAQGDRQLLKIILENLVSNALKFTGPRAQAVIQIGQLTQDGGPVYFVRDNGAGFNMQYANKLFGPFQRLHSEKEFPGSGIGLATVQRIIRRHGGRVWAESVEGQGATFYFTLA